MGNVLWAIVKDGLKALAFWLIASLVMIYLWATPDACCRSDWA